MDTVEYIYDTAINYAPTTNMILEQPTTGWLPPSGTELLIKRAPAYVYWNLPQANPQNRVMFVDDDGNEREFKAGDFVGYATGQIIPIDSAYWVEMSGVRYWQRRGFLQANTIETDKAWVLTSNDSITSKILGGGAPIIAPKPPTVPPPTGGGTTNNGGGGGAGGGTTTNSGGGVAGGGGKPPVMPPATLGGAFETAKTYAPYALALLAIVLLLVRKK